MLALIQDNTHRYPAAVNNVSLPDGSTNIAPMKLPIKTCGPVVTVWTCSDDVFFVGEPGSSHQ